MMFNRVTQMDVLLFTKHLQTMIRSGIPLGEALDALKDQSTSSYFSKIVSDIQTSVKNGMNLSESFAKHPRVFSHFYVSLIDVGEQAGTLDEVLLYLTEQLKKDYQLRKKVQSALLYPSVVLLTVMIIGASIAFFVLPRLSSLFSSFEAELPISTQILIALAGFFKNYGLISALVMIIGGILIGVCIQMKAIRPYWHSLLLKVPMIGLLVKYSQLSILSRNLALLIKSGVPISKSMEICSETLTNEVYRTSLLIVRDKTEAGESLPDAFRDVRRLPIYPVIVYKMVSVGDKTATLDEVFLYLSSYYDDEIDTIGQNISSLLEPVLLLVMGAVVGFVALAVISPIYQFTEAVQGM